MMRCWLDRGVDGFRMDVINLISKHPDLPDGPVSPARAPYADAPAFVSCGPRIHEFLQEMHREVFADRATALLTVGEMPGVDDRAGPAVHRPGAGRGRHGLPVRARRPRPRRREVGRPAAAAARPQGVVRALAGRPRRARLEQPLLEQPRPAARRVALRRRRRAPGAQREDARHGPAPAPRDAVRLRGRGARDDERAVPRRSRTSATSSRSTTTPRRSPPATTPADVLRRAADDGPRQRAHADAVGRLARTRASRPARRGSPSTRTTPRSTPRPRAPTRTRCSHHYRRLIELRHTEPVVAHGDFTMRHGRRRARLRVHPPPRRRRAVRPGQLLQRGRRRAARRPGGPRANCSSATTTRRRRPRSTARCGRGRRASTSGPTEPVQNVHAMRPEVRAEYERVRGRIDGDAAFGVRFERFFSELRDPLVPCTAQTSASRRSGRRCSTRSRPPPRPGRELRVLDHEREITPDWLHREQAVGYVAYADRFAGTLRASASGSLPARARRRLPAPDAAAARAAGAQRRRLRGRRLRRGRARARDDGRPARPRGRPPRRRAWPSASTSSSTTPPREHPWAQAAIAGDERMLAFYRTFPDRTEPDAYERTLPEVFPDIAPGNFTWVPELDRWVWTTFNDYQWDLDYTNPEVFVAMAEVVLALAAAGVDVLRLDAVPFMWKRHGTNCQNQPEVHDLLQALRAVMRIAAPGVAFKAEAIVSPGDLVALSRRGPPRGQGVRPRLPQRPHGAAVERARVGPGRAAHPHPAGDAARAARRGVGHLRALPRRHRLGDHRGGRGGGRRGRVPAPPVPRRLLRRRLPGLVRPRGALPVEPADGRRAHERDGSLAVRPRAGARGRRRGRGRSRACAGCSCSTRSPSPTAGCR